MHYETIHKTWGTDRGWYALTAIRDCADPGVAVICVGPYPTEAEARDAYESRRVAENHPPR